MADLGTIGRYSLLRPLGKGGMAEVFLARTTGLEDFQQFYAIKKFLPKLQKDRKFLRMFLDEARVTMNLQHPNIVQVHDLGEHDGEYYMVLEFVEGMDLRLMMSACYEVGTSIPLTQTLYIIREVLTALAYAHGARDHNGRPMNLVHQDISPSNVLLSKAGNVKLSDFGVARASIAKWRTDPGELVGKFRYFAPELVLGSAPSIQSDLFAVGAILYELITTEPLLLGSEFNDVRAELRDFDPELALDRDLSIPTSVEPLLLTALAREPGDRYESAEDFQADLTDTLFEERIRVSPADLSSFIDRLEEALDDIDSLAERTREPASLSLEVVDEPPEQHSESSVRAYPELEQSSSWRLPRGTDATLYSPGAGARPCQGRLLREWALHGHLGLHSLVRFEGHPWSLLRDYVGSTDVPLEPGWTLAPYTALDLHARIWQALGNRQDGTLTFYDADHVMTLQMAGGRIIGIEEVAAGGGLLRALQREGLLSATQVMVLEQVAAGDDVRAREAVESRNLVSRAVLDQLTAQRPAAALARALEWSDGRVLAGPVPDLPLSSCPPRRIDQLLVEAIRGHVDEQGLRAALPAGFDTRITRGAGDPASTRVALTPQETAIVAATQGNAVGLTDLLARGLAESPEQLLRSILLLLQFDLVRVS